MDPINHICSRCHGQAVFGFGATWLCEDCYGVIGSCCMEFDGDDMFLEDRSWATALSRADAPHTGKRPPPG